MKGVTKFQRYGLDAVIELTRCERSMIVGTAYESEFFSSARLISGFLCDSYEKHELVKRLKSLGEVIGRFQIVGHNISLELEENDDTQYYWRIIEKIVSILFDWIEKGAPPAEERLSVETIKRAKRFIDRCFQPQRN